MTNLPDDPIAALLYRLNQNINALGAAVEEVGIWLDQRGATEAYERISEHLEVLVDNSESIAELLANLIARQKPEEPTGPED